MLEQLSRAGVVLALAAAVLTPAAAGAQDYDRGNAPYHAHGGYPDERGPPRGYDRGGYAYRPRCGNGTTGTILGAIAGGLLGHSIAGRGDGALGAVLGAGGGALAGRAIDRSGNARNCRR